MFLMIGLNDGELDLHYHWHVNCGVCGGVRDLVFYMTFTQLLLFFITTLKWNKHYYGQCPDCGTVYELDPAVGKRIEHGEEVEIKPEYLTPVSRGRRHKQCPNCGYTTDENFDYCPHCGTKMN